MEAEANKQAEQSNIVAQKDTKAEEKGTVQKKKHHSKKKNNKKAKKTEVNDKEIENEMDDEED